MSDEIIVDLIEPPIIEVEFPLTGLPGVGVPPGGTTGQVLAKDSNDDYDTEWVTGGGGGGGIVDSVVAGTNITVDDTDPANPIVSATGGGGGGAVDSVNGETGVVVLTTDDIADTAANRYTDDTAITRLANTSGTNTGDQDLSWLVPNTRTVNDHALSSDVTVTKSDVGLSAVTNDAQLTIANNLSEINTADNRGTARYNLRTPMIFNAVNVYVTNVASLSGAAAASDGITPANGDTVLLVGQTTASQNGPWVVNTGGAWTRPTDFPSGGSIRSRLIQVSSGTAFANSVWGLAAPSAITIDTTAQIWQLQSKPSGVFPNILPTSGDYYSLGGQSAASTPGLNSAGKIVAHPIWLDVGTLDRIAVSSTIAAVSTWRLGLYKANPLTTLCDGEVPFLDAGTVNMNATAGLQSITISQAITQPGIYWAAVLVDAYTAQPTVHNVVYSSSSGIGWSGLPQDMSSFGRFRVGRTYGGFALPTGSLPTFPTGSMSWAGLLPRIAVRYV